MSTGVTPPLFDTAPLVKPGTLPAYGEAPEGMGVPPGTDRRAVLQAYANAAPAPLTDQEASEIAGLAKRPGAQGWPRSHELIRLGYIVQAGNRENRGGRMVRECVITEAGKAALT